MKRRRFLAVTVWALVLGGVLMVGWGLSVASAAPPASNSGNPFAQILAKLDEILTAITGGGGGNHTLRWDRVLPAAQRFVVLAAFNNAAVLDKNTGLVWEKNPSGTPRLWVEVRGFCANSHVGGQEGWRLPSLNELASLVDPNATSAPLLPTGHPFTNVGSSNYWSATTNAAASAEAWFVEFLNGNVNPANKTSSFNFWCVRGGMNADQY